MSKSHNVALKPSLRVRVNSATTDVGFIYHNILSQDFNGCKVIIALFDRTTCRE